MKCLWVLEGQIPMEVMWESELKLIQTLSKAHASGEKSYGCCLPI